MSFNTLIQVSEQPQRADKSAMAAINRALRSVAGLFLESMVQMHLTVSRSSMLAELLPMGRGINLRLFKLSSLIGSN